MQLWQYWNALLINCIYIYICLHLCAFFLLPKIVKKDINVAQMIMFFFFVLLICNGKSSPSEILATFKMSIVNIYLFTEMNMCTTELTTSFILSNFTLSMCLFFFTTVNLYLSLLLQLLCIFFFCWTSKINSLISTWQYCSWNEWRTGREYGTTCADMAWKDPRQMQKAS